MLQDKYTAAEIAKYSKEDRQRYEESLKHYRDLKNVVDTAFDEGNKNEAMKSQDK